MDWWFGEFQIKFFQQIKESKVVNLKNLNIEKDGKESNKFRGHLDLKVAERINKNWIIGLNAVRASDFSYLTRYKMGGDN